LGITQRKIRISRSHIPPNRSPRKAFPATLKTLGDRIKAWRFETDALQSEVAEKLGVSTSLIQSWENDEYLPDEPQRQILERLMNLEVGIGMQKPNS